MLAERAALLAEKKEKKTINGNIFLQAEPRCAFRLISLLPVHASHPLCCVMLLWSRDSKIGDKGFQNSGQTWGDVMILQ